MKLNFIIQASVESRTGLFATLKVEVLNLLRNGEAANVVYTNTTRVSTDNFATQVEPLLRNALTAASNQLIKPNNEEINRNAR